MKKNKIPKKVIEIQNLAEKVWVIRDFLKSKKALENQKYDAEFELRVEILFNFLHYLKHFDYEESERLYLFTLI